jgi:predicted metal-dependent phosphoesterase TrpH
MAARSGLEAISITDHDTLTGTRTALAGHMPQRLRFITGVEISAQPPSECMVNGSLHILGYGIDPDYGPLVEALDEMQHSRDQRITRIVDRLNAMGVPIALQHVLDEVGQGSAGRPHVASAMIKAGAVADIDEAFDRFLGKGSPAFVSKKRLDCARTIKLIRAAGGVAVLAHPCLIRTRRQDGIAALEPLVKRLMEMGLEGIEVHYPRHSSREVADLTDTAGRLGLLITGGSDFHGKISPEIQMGRGLGDLYVSFEFYEKLVSNHTGLKTR